MKYRVLLLLAALPSSLYSQTPKLGNWNTLDRMCGRVTDSEFTSTRWSTSYLMGSGTPKKAHVLLYRRDEKKKCCARNALVSEVPTGTNGEFEFKNAVPGQYWLVVVAGKEKYKLAVSLVLRDGRESQECSDSIFQIKGDELLFVRTITLH